MKKTLFFSFILVGNQLSSMKVGIDEINKQDSNTQEEVYLKQHTKIFPNPVKDYFYIESTDGINIQNFAIYDITGKQILLLNNSKNSTIDIDTSDYNPGIYILKIASESAIIFKKFIVV